MTTRWQHLSIALALVNIGRLAASQPTGTGDEMTSPVFLLDTTPHPDTRLVIDSPDDIRPITTDVEAVRSSMVFFSASLSMFALIAVVYFFRKCVTCPSPASRSRYYARPVDGAAATVDGADVAVVQSAPGAVAQSTTFSTPSKFDDAGMSPSVSSFIAQVDDDDDDDDDADAAGVRPPTRRSGVTSETPEALCLQDDGTWDEEDYV